MDPGLQSGFLAQSTWSAGGLRKTSPAGADGRAGSRRTPSQPIQQPPDGGVRLQAREVHPDADVRPAREGEVLARVLAAARRSGRGRRTSPGRGWRPRPTRSRARRGGSPRRPASRPWSRTGRPSRRPARAAATPRWRWAAGPRSAGHERELVAAAESRCRTALAIIPSVVSMPPKSITAALDTTSRALEAARIAAGGGEHRRAGLAIEHGLDGGPQLGEGRRGRRREPRRRP